MPNRRILSLWFPRLAAERVLRQTRGVQPVPFAVVGEEAQMQRLASLSRDAESAGLTRGQPLRDARAMCPALITRPADPLAEAAFLTALRRWAGRFTPWVAEEPPEALVLDITGCAHLFGGEAGMMVQIMQDCADLGLTVRAAVADTPGAALALARYGGQSGPPARTGDAIRQEARATRSRAAKRRAPAPPAGAPPTPATPPQGAPPGAVQGRIVPPGLTRAAIGPLPLAALRLPPATVAQLARLGLRRVEDLLGQPRAALARRFGRETLHRLDQALGVDPEPISPAGAPAHFAVRLSFPDPIGLRDDILAGLDRMLPGLCARLADAGRGARRVRLQAFRADGGSSTVELGLARAATTPERIRPLLELVLDRIEAGFGIDVLRLEAHVTEPVHAVAAHRGHLDATADAAARQAGSGAALDDLLGRLGARVGMEAITRLHPGDSHIPEKAVQTLSAAWSEPATGWIRPGRSGPGGSLSDRSIPGQSSLDQSRLDRPGTRPDPDCASNQIRSIAPASTGGTRSRRIGTDQPKLAPAAPPRPLLLLRQPELVTAPDDPAPPARFRWRGRTLATTSATGPERIAPEWWLDDPAWRSGVRDYWRVETEEGARLWLAYAHGGEMSGGWFCHGIFA